MPSASCTPHIILSIRFSALLKILFSTDLTTQVSEPYVMRGFTYPINLSFNIPCVSYHITEDTLLNAFQPSPILRVTASLLPPPPFTLSPK